MPPHPSGHSAAAPRHKTVSELVQRWHALLLSLCSSAAFPSIPSWLARKNATERKKKATNKPQTFLITNLPGNVYVAMHALPCSQGV